MLLLIGCHKLSDCKMYWETPPNNFVQTMSDSMLVIHLSILQNLNLCDNEKLDKQDEFSKLLLLTTELNKNLLKFSLNLENKFMDKSMISY